MARRPRRSTLRLAFLVLVLGIAYTRAAIEDGLYGVFVTTVTVLAIIVLINSVEWLIEKVGR